MDDLLFARGFYHRRADHLYEKHYDNMRTAVHPLIYRAMVGDAHDASMLTRWTPSFDKIKGIHFPLAHFGDLCKVN